MIGPIETFEIEEGPCEIFEYHIIKSCVEEALVNAIELAAVVNGVCISEKLPSLCVLSFADYTKLVTAPGTRTDYGYVEFSDISFGAQLLRCAYGIFPVVADNSVGVGTIYLLTKTHNAGASSVCECGSDKAGVAGHSHWCPKYKI